MISAALLACILAAAADAAPCDTLDRAKFPEIAIVGFSSPLNLPNSAQDFGSGEQTEDLKPRRFVLKGDVLFDFDKSELRPDADAYLRDFFDQHRKQLTDQTIVIEGHTDSKGSHAYNLRLSRQRARTILDWIVRNANLRPKRTVELGFGESRPKAPNTSPDGSDSPEGRQLNRRVEIVVRG
jgi:outer membrane protein OmpA-like peptidoglycan-associated protein